MVSVDGVWCQAQTQDVARQRKVGLGNRKTLVVRPVKELFFQPGSAVFKPQHFSAKRKL